MQLSFSWRMKGLTDAACRLLIFCNPVNDMFNILCQGQSPLMSHAAINCSRNQSLFGFFFCFHVELLISGRGTFLSRCGWWNTWTKYVGVFFFRSLRYFTHRHTWEDAEKDCREHSAHLSSVATANEQEFINGKLLLLLNTNTTMRKTSFRKLSTPTGQNVLGIPTLSNEVQWDNYYKINNSPWPSWG